MNMFAELNGGVAFGGNVFGGSVGADAVPEGTSELFASAWRDSGGDWFSREQRNLRVRKELERERLKAAEVLHHVWLYDDEEDSRKLVDGSGKYGVYASGRARLDERMLPVYGRDYAEAVMPGRAGEPWECIEVMLDGMADEGRKAKYKREFEGLKVKGGDTADDYYGLLGRMVRDEVRGQYMEAKQEEARQRELLKQQAMEYEQLIDGGMKGSITVPTPEQFELLNRGGIKWESIQRARRAAGLAKGDRVNQSLAADMLEGDEIARQLVLQEVARSSKEHREEMEGENYFSSLLYGQLRVLEHLGGKIDRYLPRASTPVRELDVTRPQMVQDADGSWRVVKLTEEEQAARQRNRDAFMGEVEQAREAGVAEAEEGIGWKASHIGANLQRMAIDLGEFIHPVTRAYNIAHFAEDSYYKNMAAGRSVAMSAAEFEKIAEEQGREVAEATAAQRARAVSMGQVYAKSAVNTLAYWAGMKVGTQHVGKAVNVTLPFTRRVLPGLAKFNATRGGSFATSTLASTIDLAVMDGVTGGINALYECVPGVDEKLDSGLAELAGLWANLGKTQTWVETLMMGAIMGGGMGGRHTQSQALELLRERQGALRAGLTARQFDSVAHLEPKKRDERLLAMVREGMKRDGAGMIKRAVKESHAELDRERALQMREDKAIHAAMEEFGLSVEGAEDGNVNLYYDGEVQQDGTFKRGEKFVVLTREEADVYIQAVLGSRLEGMARVFKHAVGSKRLLDAFRDELKGDVRVEWMREADNLAKYEGWKERALERIETRVSERMAQDGMSEADARREVQNEVHKDISERGTLGELVQFATNMRERFEQEQASRGEVLDPRAFGSRANVTRQRAADDGQLRRVLRVAQDARVDEIAEELGEQVMNDWLESQGMSVTEGYRYLREFVDWAKQSDNAEVRKAAEKLLSLDKTHPELAERLMQEGFNEYDLSVDEYRAVVRELTEAGSTLMLSELRQAAADGNMPGWARDLFEVADLNLLELERDMNLAMAMAQARAEGVLPEAAQKLFGAGREAVEAALREEPETQEYHQAWYEVQKRQGELDAAYGAGKLTEPSITEDFEARARRGQDAVERAREEEEARAAEGARERLEEFKAEPENEGKSHEEVVQAAAERAADAAMERMQGELGAKPDADFAGGVCLEITDDEGLVCKSGLLEVGKLKVLPNFKLGADADSGVVHPLKGDYRPDHDPIRVWRKSDGELLVISGRHRLDAARRAGVTRISAYVYDESGVRDLAWARRYDIESNIRDNQATPLEVALYVRGEFTGGKPLSNEEVEAAGITREGKLGSIGFRIGRRAGEAVMDALRNGAIDDRVALWIADFCPGNDAVQRRGLDVALRDGSKAEVLARMEAELAKQQMQEEMGLDGGTDLFGNTLDNDEFMDFVAQYVLRRRNELAQDASYLNATAKKRNAEAMGKKYGVDVKDPVALKKKLAEINALRERWKNPYSDSELMDEIRAAWRGREGLPPSPEEASSSGSGVATLLRNSGESETPSERLFREYAAREWQTERTDYSGMVMDKPMVRVDSVDVPEDKPSLVARLKELTGRKFYNKSADMQATISGESAKKIARAESETITNLTRLGYTEAEASYIHRAAATKIGELYEQSVLFFEEDVYHKADDRKAAWHFFEPVTVELNGRDEAFLTNISVIDFTRGGERLFSLELTIENPISNAEGMAAPASGRQAQHPNGVSDVRIAAFESFVKKEKNQIERNAREKGLIPWRVDEARVHELQGEAGKIEKEIEALLAKFGGDEEKIQGYRRDRIKLHDLREQYAKKKAEIAAEYKPDSLPDVAQPIAPNGKPSRLSVDEWLTVRTKAFKAWFGDWENAPENASKVVDENGEPLVVYHGSLQWFQIFNDGNERHQSGAPDGTIFANDNREIAVSFVDYYGGNAENVILNANDARHARMPWGVYRKGGIYPLFMNLKNPLVVDFEGMTWHGEKYDIKDVNWYAEEARKKGHDGLIIRNVIDVGFTDTNDVPPSTDYVAFESNQVKSATDNRGTFDADSSRIDFSVIGPNAVTWDKYRERMFTGRDDGMLRAEIDASQAKLLPVMKAESAYKTEVKRAVRLLFELALSTPEYEKKQRARRLALTTQSSMVFGTKLGDSEAWDKLKSFICDGKEPGEVLRELGLSEGSEYADIVRAHEAAEAEYKKSCRELVEMIGVSGRNFEMAFNHVTGNGSGAFMLTEGDWDGLGGTLGEVLDYPELYEAYPALREVKMTYKDGGASHSRIPRGAELYEAEIVLGTDKTPEQMRSTLLHEVQHLIQLHEDFAFGGAPSNVRRIFERLGRQDELGPEEDVQADYKRLAGEIEARAVSRRQYMSAEERAAKPFNESLEHEGRALTYRVSEYYAAIDAERSNVTHYSICGLKAKTANEYLEKGADYVDPADGQRKFVIPVSGARLRSDVTPGMLNVAAGGHKDVSLAALLHYPELYRAYPQLAEMRVRLFKPVGETNVGGYFSPEVGTEQAAYIAVNVASRLEVLNTLLHESQHAIQQLEGFAMGAGSFDQGMALAYLGQAIEQRRAAGVNDDWSRDNMAYLERLREGVEKGSEDSIIMTYLMSHGEQEARYTGGGRGAVGENPTAEGAADGLTGGAPSSYTVAVRTNATDLGGVTFLNMGRFGYLMDSRLMPAGEFHYDRRVYQMRENIMRRMRELRAQTDGAEEADGLRLAAEGLAVMDSVEALLPNTYRAALEPYKVYFNTYAKLRGSGDAGKAAATVPMKGWDMRMFGSFYGMVYRLISGKAEADGEFWEHAFNDVAGAEEGMEAMREVWEEVHEQVAEEYAERLADAPNAKAKKKLRALIEQETFSRIELQFSEEMNKLFQALGSMRADRLMAKFLERVALQLDAFRKDTTLGRIRRVVDGLTPLPGKDGKPVKGRMEADAYRKVMDMMRLLELTKGERLAFERTRYTGEKDCPDGDKVWADVAPDELITVDTYDADGTPVEVTCTKQEYETYACFDGMTTAQAESAGKALGEFITTGRQAWDNMEELRKQRIAKMCTPLMETHAESLNDERHRHHLEKRGELPLTSWARKIHAVFGSWMNDAQFFDAMTGVKEVEGFARDFTDRMARAKVYIESKEKERRAMMMDAVFEASGAKTGKEAREFIDYINRTERTGIVLKPQEPDFLELETAELRAQFMGLLRRKTHKKNFRPNTFAAMMQHLADAGEDVVPAHIMEEAMAKYGEIGDVKKSVLQGAQAMASVLTKQEYERFHNMTKAAKKRADKAREKWLSEQKEKDAAVRPDDGTGLELTRSEAAYRVLLCEQADYEETLRRQGYTEAVVRQLEEFAGERMMRLAYRLRDELGTRTPQIKEVYERVYGMPFPEVENYFRAYFDAGYEVHSEAIMGGAGEGRAAGKGTAKILYTRHHHNAKIDPTMNVLGAFECAMKEQDIMLGYGDLPTDISQVLNYRDGDLRMSDALAKVFSTHTVGEMKLIADNMTRAVPAAEETARWMTRCLSAMGSSTATAVLNYRVGTLFKQGTALFNTLAGSDRVSWWEWHKAAARANLGIAKISLAKMAERPELDGRFKGWAASVNAEALLGDADVISAKGATAAAARAGMSLMEWIDMRANVRACVTLYDAVYRKTQRENPELTHEELDADAMNEVRRALAFKSQPLDWRSRALLGGKKSLFSIGNLFLGGESINTMGNVLRLMARAKRKRDWGKAAYVWLEHGIALQVLTYIYNWMTDDEEQWERRSWKQYVAGSVLGPLAGLPLVSAFVGAGTGVLNTFLPKEARVWMPTQSLLPMADMERVVADLRKVFWGKKPSSWQDKTIAVENFIRVLATFGILASRNPTTAGGAKVKAMSYGVAAVTNILDFLLRTERAFEERVLD